MLLRENNVSAPRVFLAAIPLFYAAASLPVIEAVSMAAIIIALFLLTALFFYAATSYFPDKFRQAAYVLWLAVLTQSAYTFLMLPPFWVVSLVLLAPNEIFEKGGSKKLFYRVLARSLFFIVLIAYLAAFQDLLGKRFLVWIFKTPAGAFLLLAFAALIWKNQPGAEEGAP